MDLDLSQKLYEIISQISRQTAREEFILLLNEQFDNGLNIQSILNYSKNSTNSIIRDKIGWLRVGSSLSNLYEIIYNHGFIRCDLKTFQNRFIGPEDAASNITWFSSTTELVYLFNQLSVEGFIPEPKHPHKLLKDNFLDRYGNPLKSNSLRSILNNVRDSKGISIIDNIMHELHKCKY